MNVNPKQGIIKGYANISENKTIALDYKENNVVSKWYPWAPVPEKTMYAWKNGTDIIYTLTNELTTGPIDIFTNGTTLTRTTADAIKAGDVEIENAWFYENNDSDNKKQGYLDATTASSWGTTPIFDTISTNITDGFQEKSKTLIWKDGDYNSYSRSHLSRIFRQTYQEREVVCFALNTASDDEGFIETINKTGVTIKVNAGAGNTFGPGYQIYYTPLVSIDHIKYDSKVWLRDETSDITIGE